MNISLAFTRVFFIALSIFLMTVYMMSSTTGSPSVNALMGIGIGCLFGLLLIGFDTFFRRFNLRSFNTAILGIFVGYLMGQGLLLIFDAVLEISSISITLQAPAIELLKMGLFLFGIYLGTIMLIRSSDEISVSIPFIKFAPLAQKKKDLLVDVSVLSDPRIIDLCSTGMLDHQMILPRFILKELYSQSEIGDELVKAKARRSLEVVKKLEEIPSLGLRYSETDFPETRELTGKLIRLARHLDSNIISADISRVQMSTLEGVKVVNLHSLSNALKPLTQNGEMLKIKIQRYGKEPRQGIGYLEDGTMVVVNEGGNYIGEIIDAQVLSVKHTSSGRMIFCNALDENENYSQAPYDEAYDDEK